jgi:colicin import membrane protein
MARKLKTFVTTIGFFEQAVAAPSMKPALDAWGVTQNLFQQGFAKESDDPKIISAATAQPGVVVKRAVGSKGDFAEDAELPASLPAKRLSARGGAKPKASKPKTKQARNAPTPSKDAARAQMLAYEKALAKQARERDRERERRAAAQARDSERRALAVRKTQALFDQAQKRHQAKKDVLERQMEVARRKIDAELKRWRDQKAMLDERLGQSR